jgi:hypothetical protein
VSLTSPDLPFDLANKVLEPDSSGPLDLPHAGPVLFLIECLARSRQEVGRGWLDNPAAHLSRAGGLPAWEVAPLLRTWPQSGQAVSSLAVW